jgi:hypothetical protein
MNNLRAVFEDCRNDEPFMERLLAAFGITAIVFLSITLLRLSGGYAFAALQQPPSPQAERTLLPPAAAEAANHTWAEIVAHCMNGGRFVWTDPHTGFDYAAHCEVVRLGRIP